MFLYQLSEVQNKMNTWWMRFWHWIQKKLRIQSTGYTAFPFMHFLSLVCDVRVEAWPYFIFYFLKEILFSVTSLGGSRMGAQERCTYVLENMLPQFLHSIHTCNHISMMIIHANTNRKAPVIWTNSVIQDLHEHVRAQHLFKWVSRFSLFHDSWWSIR